MGDRPVKAYPTLGCCGLDCGLCPRYYTASDSWCPGCCGPGFFEKRPACGYITCCVKKRGLEACAQCDEFPCARFERWIDRCWEHDSFVTHAKVKDNMTFIQEHGLDAFLEQQQRRIQILEAMLEGFNDGRSRSFFCIGATLLPIRDLESALEKSKEAIHVAAIASDDIKARSRVLRGHLQDSAMRGGIELKLWRRQAK